MDIKFCDDCGADTVYAEALASGWVNSEEDWVCPDCGNVQWDD